MKSLLDPKSRQDWSQQTRPVVSVMCWSYNQEAFLASALDAILAQETSFPIEIIVHDDASTDQTQSIIRAFAERYPKIIRPIISPENLHRQNLRVRPRVLPEAKGEFIAYCDGDDRWSDPLKLARQVQFLRDHQEHVVTYHGAVVVDHAGNLLAGKKAFSKNKSFTSKELRCARAEILSGTMMHRNIPIDFPPEFNLCQNGDRFFPVLLAPYGSCSFQPEIAPLECRKHDGGSWSSLDKKTRNARNLATSMQIASYLFRMGDNEAANFVLSKNVIRGAQRQLRYQRSMSNLFRFFR